MEIKPGLLIKKHNEISYKTLKTKIIGLQAGLNKLAEASPSGSLAIQTDMNPEITKADSLLGCIASTENNLPEIVYKIKVRTTLFKEIIGAAKEEKVEPIKINEPLLLSINTSISVGFASLLQKDMVDFKLKIPVVAIKGSKVGIARNIEGHWRLIGYGEII